MCIRKDRSKEDNMEEYYLICEDSLEGIFTGVYDAYLWKQPLERVHLLTREEDNYRLFAQYQNCVPEDQKGSGKSHEDLWHGGLFFTL